MHASQPLRVPVGHDAARWSTFHGEKTLVVAARTVTSTVRVLECLPALLRGDEKVTVVFAYDPTSAFNDGVLDLLHDAGCRVMPWAQLSRISPDLIVSASENIEVPDGDCPVLVLPHGIGFQKFVPDSRSARERLSGLVPDPLLEAGRAWLAVSHPGQEEQLLAAHPKASGHTLLVGDPCFDELRAGVDDAEAYRRALGVGDGQRLVVVSSTWGATSLLGRLPHLPARLLSALPCDEYRVAAILHPNIWSGHGAWQIRTLQAAALDAGLMLIPPVHAWRSALLAASMVIGDHGSVTLYGAALGKPVLLGAFGADAVPGTAVTDLGRSAPHLDPHGDLRGQIEETLRTHTSHRYAEIADRAFADPGEALTRLRACVYQLMGQPEPTAAPPPVLAPPLPEPVGAAVTSWVVTTSVVESVTGHPIVTLRRRPAAACADIDEAPDTYVHLACDIQERDGRLTQSASVLVRRTSPDTASAAVRWVRDTLDRFPGSLLTAASVRGGTTVVGLRDGRVVEATATGSLGDDPGLAAAVVYSCLRAGLVLDDTVATLRIGDVREEDVVVRLRPGLQGDGS